MKQAIIDIGSNSVRLMLWADGKTLYKRLATTRLGEGIAIAPLLKREAIERSARAVADFAEQGRKEGANVRAFATAAVRSALNGAEFCMRARELSGLTVDVVSGEDEAQLALFGALGQSDGAILDVGGASTEVCARENGEIVFARSFNVGAVRLYDLCGDEREKLLPVIVDAIAPLRGTKFKGNLFAVGGTATTLASVKLGLKEYDGAKIQNLRLTREEVSLLSDRLLSATKEERKGLAGMDERRADIIAGGALLVSEIMKTLALGELYVSDRDNLEGYLTLRGLI